MNGDPLEYWQYQHERGHNPTKANPTGYDPECPFCNPEAMKAIMEEA